MTKETMRYLNIDVLGAAQQRIDYVFNEFDNVYVSFSGGKDSGLLLYLCIDWLRNHAPHRRLGVLHLDYEAQYTATTKYVDATFTDLVNSIDLYRCCVPFKVTTCTSMFQTHWRPWEAALQRLWVRPLPSDALTKDAFDFFREDMWDYEFQEQFGEWLHKKTGAQKTCCLVGIRTQESLNRWRAIASDNNVNTYHDNPWTTSRGNVVNAYPIYDWQTEDVWTANAKFGYPYNDLYTLMHQAGVPLGAQRVASPFLSTAQESLKLYRAIDPHMWGKLISRVNGVNFTGIYGGTKAMGWKTIEKPSHFSWKQYMEFLLTTLPQATANSYRDKLNTSIKFWRERGGVLSEDAVNDLRKAGIAFERGDSTNYKTDKLPVRMDYADEIESENFALIPTFKRMCVCILKNDHLCKYMGFALTKNENIRRKEALEKYANI